MIPDRIGEGQAPGGVVVRIYRAGDGELIRESRIRDPYIAAMAAVGDAEATEGQGDLVLVGYDGDTGERMRMVL